MRPQTQTDSEPMKALRRIALGYPETQEGVVCTRCAFKARNKAFMFMGMDDISYHAMVKLGDSLDQAAQLAAKEPNGYKVGGHGWVTATFSHEHSPPPGLLERWINESYRLLVHKELVAMLPEFSLPTAGSAAPAKKKSRKKAARR